MNWRFWKNYKKVIKETTVKMGIGKKYIFPCSEEAKCLVRLTCNKACDKIEMDDEKVMELFLEHNGCPDCGSEKFMEGPAGGMSQNVKCAGCGHWFNMALPVFIQRIHISNGRFYD